MKTDLDCSPDAGRLRGGIALGAGWFAAASVLAAAPPSVPECPADWGMELVAQSPALRHPTVVCAAPDGRVFVAEDPMDISAPRADAPEGRILCFKQDGTRTVFADHLQAVFGMQYLEGKLFVLHNPRFSVFTDHDGVGVNREELIESMQPNPWALDWNDHVPANFRLAMDGYFYVAIGDKGVYGAVGRDGKRVDLHGGGVLRLRPDGTELEVYCTGTRNILDVALNIEDEIFTYDNTDEHDWMGRLTHMVDGGVYGYPHDFVPRRPYTLWMMHDFGGGAATGALACNEDALPAGYRGNLFLADFGKRQVLRVRIAREGATYRVTSHEEFFQNPPEDFRPVGIAWSDDGLSLFICDWQHRDTKENVTVGRLWRARYRGASQAAPRPSWYVAAATGRPIDATVSGLVRALSHPSRNVRLTAQRRLVERKESGPLIALLEDRNAPAPARWHALWALDAIDGGRSARAVVLGLVKDPDTSLRRQAIRQLGQRRAAEAGALLRECLNDADVSVRFQAATALGRIGDAASVPSLLAALNQPDLFARFAAFTALNRVGRNEAAAWPEIVQGLQSGIPAVREGVEFALREIYDLALAEALISFGLDPGRPAGARAAALRILAGLERRPPLWKGDWWAYHPALAAPPAKTELWAGTPRIAGALVQSLNDPEARLRLVAVEGLRSASETNAAGRLRERFAGEPDAAVRRAIVRTLGEFKDRDAEALLVDLVQGASTDGELLGEVLDAAGAIGGKSLVTALGQFAGREAATDSLREKAIEALARLRAREAVETLAEQANCTHATVRAAAIRALGQIGGAEALAALRGRLTEASTETRREVVLALGALRDTNAVPDLLAAWNSEETRAQGLEALARVSDPRALEAYLEALSGGNAALREQVRQVLGPIRDEMLLVLEKRAGAMKPEVLIELRRVYEGHARAAAGPLFTLKRGGLEPADYERYAMQHAGDARRGQGLFFDETRAACVKCHAVAGQGGAVGPDLTLIGAQFPRATLIEHVLDPSKVVREGYQQVQIELRDGEEISGLLSGETADALTLIDGEARRRIVSKAEIVNRSLSRLSLMPEGLQAGMTPEQFADLIAYLESRRTDPRQPGSQPVPEGFISLFNGRDLEGWREFPDQPARVSRSTPAAPAVRHWLAREGVLEHDGKEGDLWTEREFGDFTLRLDWRWSDRPVWEEFPLIGADGLEQRRDGRPVTERVLDAGDSGVFLRGFRKAQANLFCYPVGSGEVWEYRTDPNMTPEQRRAVTPRRQADAPIGDWNRMEITLRGQRLTVVLNGEMVIADAALPGIPARGPIGLQHEHGRIQFRNLWIREGKER